MQVNTVYLFVIKQGGAPVKRWREYSSAFITCITCVTCTTCITFGPWASKIVRLWLIFYLDILNFLNSEICWTQCSFPVLDLRSSPASLAASLPSANLVASPDCSVICDDKDFFKLVILLQSRYCILYVPSFQASGEMSPQKAVALGKLKVRGNFLLLQKLQGLFWTFLWNIFPLEYIGNLKFLRFGKFNAKRAQFNCCYFLSLFLGKPSLYVNWSNLFHIFWSKPFKDISTIVTQK